MELSLSLSSLSKGCGHANSDRQGDGPSGRSSWWSCVTKLPIMNTISCNELVIPELRLFAKLAIISEKETEH